MKIKVTVSIVLGCLLVFSLVVTALAGSSFDFGLIEGTPLPNQANWTAWINEAKNILPGGMPNEIMTEDGTNSETGENIGYSQYDLDLETEWILQVEAFSNESHGDDISLIFGGLSASNGKLWFYNFVWDQFTNFETDHGTIALGPINRPCPIVTGIIVNGNNKTISFTAEASKTYYVYKSTIPSGAPNAASNGRYLYLATVTTNASGLGVYTDAEPLESWYTLIRKSDVSGALDGCHSESGEVPTAVTLAEFTAQTQAVASLIRLEWGTVNEFNLLGFNVYRAETLDGPRTILNPSLLLAQYLGDLQGGSYSFEDATVSAGKTYFYWIQMNHMIGMPEVSDPLEVTVPYKVYLPLYR